MSKIFKNENKRYELDGTVLSSGDPVLLNLGTEDEPQWVRGRIEHDGDDYYFLARSEKHISLTDGDEVKIVEVETCW
ncbi:DUF5348 domain-containing protein [Clostridium perfringens]|nr:DUF5348 domain-containing protein [Clostridium perfringens]